MRLALVLAVEGLLTDAAGEASHSGVYGPMSEQRALGGEALTTLVTDIAVVHGQCVLQVLGQIRQLVRLMFFFKDISCMRVESTIKMLPPCKTIIPTRKIVVFSLYLDNTRLLTCT